MFSKIPQGFSKQKLMVQIFK